LKESILILFIELQAHRVSMSYYNRFFHIITERLRGGRKTFHAGFFHQDLKI